MYVVLVSLVYIHTGGLFRGVVPGKTDNLRTLYVTER
jgi:hypothetical protein